jgi:molecular chaperone GrpE
VSGDFGPGDPRAEEFAEIEFVDDPEGLSGDAISEPEGDDVEVVEVETERSPLEEVAHERDEYLDALRRLQAEFENFRKRTARQQSEMLARANESLIERLLPVLDVLDLAIEHEAPPEDAASEGQTSALVQIGTMLRDILAKEGLERIAATDVEFDPTIHDAVAHVPAGEGEQGGHLIDDIFRPGYRLKDRVLRPAMVQVRG